MLPKLSQHAKDNLALLAVGLAVILGLIGIVVLFMNWLSEFLQHK